MNKNALESFKKYLSRNSKSLFLAILTIFILIRIYMGANLPIWFFINSSHDDVLLLTYSNLPKYFTQWNILTLTKNIAYPVFLFFVNLTGISYKLWLTILSLVSGSLVIYAINKFITKNKIILILAFIFICFLPIGFDMFTTARVYRNAILMPCTLIYLTTLFIFINTVISKRFKCKKAIFWAIIVGLTFTFTFYIKEDGIMLLPILLASILAVIIFKFYKIIKENERHISKSNAKRLIKIFIICIIPLLIFSAGTIGLKETNEHYFGVSEINTRNGGEMGDFWKNLLKIEDSNKNTDIWVPPSTIEKAWNASPTLQSRPDLLNDTLHTNWAQGDLKKNPLTGDTLLWAFRDSLHNVGLYTNEQTASNFLSEVNDDLDSAFENGTIEKSDKIFISESANGKSLNEILELYPYILSGIKANLFYEGITINDVPLDGTTFTNTNGQTEYTELILNDNFIMTNNNPDTVAFKEKIPIKLMNIDIMVYQSISYILVALSIIGFVGLGIYQIKNKFKNRTLNTLLGFQILLLGTFLVQIVGISWFSIWIGMEMNTIMKFYTASSQGVFALFEVLAICSLYYLLSKKKILKRN